MVNLLPAKQPVVVLVGPAVQERMLLVIAPLAEPPPREIVQPLAHDPAGNPAAYD